MATAQLEDSPLARLILSKERPHLLAPIVDPSIPIEPSGLSEGSTTLPIVVLTEDVNFSKQIRGALGQSADVTVINTQDEAAQLAVSGRCPILITDLSLTRASIEELTKRLRAHDPALVLIASGTRDLGGLFIGLQSSGAVDGFLLKPVTAGAAQLVIESATKRYRAFGSTVHAAPELTQVRSKARLSQVPTVSASVDTDAGETIEARMPARAEKVTVSVAPTLAPRPPRSIPRPSWSLVVAALLVVAAGVWWTMSRQLPSIDPEQVIAEHLARAELARQSGHWIGQRNSAAFHFQTVLALDPQNVSAQRGLDRVAAELSRRTQAAMSQRRLAEAAATLESLRELQPDYAELPLLSSQLTMLRDAVLAEHTPVPAAPATAASVAASEPPPARLSARQSKRAPVQDSSTPALSIEPRAQPSLAARGTDLPVANGEAIALAIPESSNAPLAPSATPQLSGSSSPPTTNLDLDPVAIPIPQTESNDLPVAVAQAAGAMTASPGLPYAAEEVTTASSQPTPSAPTLVKYVAPIYPSEAQARDIEGWVQVSLRVTPSGDVAHARVEDGQKRQLFSKAALAAVRQWKYTPRPDASGETPVSVRLDFQLKP